jgi:hypothetical protein
MRNKRPKLCNGQPKLSNNKLGHGIKNPETRLGRKRLHQTKRSGSPFQWGRGLR